MCEVDDVELLERARRGDENAFSRLFARHQGAIYRYAAHMCGRDASDDVVQETFLALLRQTGRYDASRGTVVAYLFGIARHCVSKRLTARRDAALDDAFDESIGQERPLPPTVLDDLSRAEAIEAVRAAVQALPPVFREAVVLCELEEMDYADAAEVMHCPIGTVRSRLHRARALLTSTLAALQPVRDKRGS
jgi:RNA polymerase sigma-70 factor (ECF subfamily)